MFSNVAQLKMTEENFYTAIPSYLCILAMPLFYSISEGISFGIISYVLICLLCGKSRELNKVMCIIAVLFVLKYLFL